MNVIRSLIEDFKAWKRGETRVAARECTGRVYAPKEAPTEGGGCKVMHAKGVLTLDRRVYRAATGEWEDLPQLRTEQ